MSRQPGLAARSHTGNSDGIKPPPEPDYRHRFPAEIIRHAVWLYHVFSFSLRDVELLLAERGVVVSYETIRRRCKKFGRSFANRLRRRRPRPGDWWHLLPDVEQRQSRYLNNRAVNSHRPTRRRERQMQRFKSPEQAQDFLSAHAFIHGHFHPRRDLLAADAYHALRSVVFDVRHHETCARHTT